MSAGCDVIMWRRPAMAVLVQCAITTLWLSSLTYTSSSLGPLRSWASSSAFSTSLDPSGWQVSVKSANYVAAMLPNTLGATEGVLRIAAVGSDFKLFLKVVLALYLLSAIGGSASGATVIYTGMFFLPYAFTENLSHPTPKSVHMRHLKENCIACMGPPRFLRLQAIYGHTSAALIACWFSIILQHCGSSSLFLSL
ncbi:hypothetical protein CY35_10G029400 [Sphagnum magellanicum]|nr:hypothetical protein CY35_10G029400 [Sphagnum magellanicum]